MGKSEKINRRKFVGSAAAASLAFTVVPSNVLGGNGHVAPSDKLTIGYIGCGTQGLREMVPLLENEAVQIVDEDDDFDEDGFLKSEVKQEYEDKFADMESLADTVADDDDDDSYGDDFEDDGGGDDED